MAFQLILEASGAGVYIEFTGVVSGSELVTVTREMYALTKNKPLLYSIADFSRSERLNFSEADLLNLAFMDNENAERHPDQVVAIVGSENLFLGAQHRYSNYTQAWAEYCCQQFCSLAEARIWISRVHPCALGSPD